MTLDWIYSQEDLDWEELSSLYIAAGMGNKAPADIKTAFSNSMFKCFVYDSKRLIGVGRALADGFVRRTFAISRCILIIRGRELEKRSF